MNKTPFTFSKRATGLSSSAIRDILKVTELPDIISFAGGLPAPDGFPVKELHAAFDKVFNTVPNVALQYGPTEGYLPLRQWLVQDLKRQDIDVSVDEVLIVSGSQQALDLLGKLFIDPGSKILVESPTYLGALQSFSQYDPVYENIPTDESGLIPSAITAEFADKARFLYAMPNFQNPTGRSLSLERRLELVQSCSKLNVPIIEDDPYGELRFQGEPLPSLLFLGRQHGATVIRMGSFSKVLAPGLRLGYIVAPTKILDKLVQLKQAADLHTQTISQIAVYETINGDFFQHHLPKVRELYRHKCHIMLDAIAQHFPATCTWSRPSGGMFIWVNLPEHIDTVKLLPQVVEQCKVAYVPGLPFYTDALTAPKNNLRLSFVTVSESKIREGIASLSSLIKTL